MHDSIELRPETIEFDPVQLHERPALRLSLNTPNLGSFHMMMTPAQARTLGAAFTDYSQRAAANPLMS
jgi:hypothetical protein